MVGRGGSCKVGVVSLLCEWFVSWLGMTESGRFFF